MKEPLLFWYNWEKYNKPSHRIGEKPGTTVLLTVKRNGEIIEVELETI
jgi:hypothetical protein